MRLCLPLFFFALIGCTQTPTSSPNACCNGGSQPDQATKSPSGCCAEGEGVQEPANPSALSGEAKLTKVKAAEFEKIIASHKGKVIAVDVWADFCAPCKKAFPHIVKL